MSSVNVVRYDKLSPGTPPTRSMKMRNLPSGRGLRRAAARKKKKHDKLKTSKP